MKSPNDKTPDSNDGLDDHDIAMLFREQTIVVPAELDDAILNHAKNAVNKTEATTAFKPVNRRISHWFALAATVVIGISVTPLLLRAPESTLPAGNSESSYRAPVALDTVDEIATDTQSANEISGYALQLPQPSSSPVDDDLSDPSSENRASRVAQAEARLSSQSSLSAAPSASSELARSGIDTDSAMLEQSSAFATQVQEQASGNTLSPQTKEEPSKLDDEKKTQLYRSTAKTWLLHIRTQIATGNLEEAEDEFERFRKAYPDEEPDLTLQLMKTDPSQLSPTRPEKPDE